MSRILVVDDTAVLREPVVAALRNKGYQADYASDGEEALVKMQTFQPDLILLDMAMPRMDGPAFLRRIRSRVETKSLPVIMLTAIAEKDRIVEVASLGISGYLLKSNFSLNELFDLIAGHVSPVSEIVSPLERVATDIPSPPPTGDLSTSSSPAIPAVDSSRRDDPVGSLRQLKPVLSREQAKEAIDQCQEIRGFSPTVALLLKITGNPNCSLDDVVKAAGQDHAIALKLMRMANSVVYNRGELVDSVRTAVVRIGMKKIRQAIMNIGVIEHFSAKSFGGLLNIGLFWEHAIGTGLIASEIQYALDPKNADTDAAFTMGLLHDVGRLVLMEQLGETYAGVLRTACDLELPVEQVEKRMILIDHASVMDRLLHAWKFPKEVINPIVFHHLSAGNVRQSAPSDASLVSTLCLANRLAHSLLLGSAGNDTVYPIEDHLQLLNFPVDSLERIVAEIPEKVLDIKLAMLSQISNKEWPQARIRLLGNGQNDIRPVFVGMKPKADSYAVLCDQLREPGIEDAPNVVVVHLLHGRDQVALGSKLEAMEQKGISPELPVVMLSASGDLQMESRLLNRRNHVKLQTPVSSFRLLRTMRNLLGPS